MQDKTITINKAMNFTFSPKSQQMSTSGLPRILNPSLPKKIKSHTNDNRLNQSLIAQPIHQNIALGCP